MSDEVKMCACGSGKPGNECCEPCKCGSGKPGKECCAKAPEAHTTPAAE